MKKIFLFILTLTFVMSFVVAQNMQNGSQEAVITATQNQGESSQLQVRTQLTTGTYFNQEGKEMQVRVGEQIQLRVRDVEANSSLNITQSQEQEQTRLHVQLSNGINSEIKIMPDVASETAINQLRLRQCNETNNCTIELKEVGTGQQVRAAYEIKAQKESRVLGIFRAQMNVQTQVNAETGEVIRTQKPWWAFLATE